MKNRALRMRSNEYTAEAKRAAEYCKDLTEIGRLLVKMARQILDLQEKVDAQAEHIANVTQKNAEAASLKHAPVMCPRCGRTFSEYEGHKAGAYMTVYNDLKKVDVFMGKYDAKHGSEQFMHGVLGVMEVIASGAGIHDEYESQAVSNMIKSEGRS